MGNKGRKGDELVSMKAYFREAKENGDRLEMARWANQIGHALKDRGDYVEALTYFRLDYDISSKQQSDGPRVGLMPTCQSLGEAYFRLRDYKEALVYQERHLELAVEADDLQEQQRSLTQLGRTFMEMYESNEDLLASRKANDAFRRAMELVKKLKANPPAGSSSNFVVELVDAYNNLGTLKMVTEDPVGARKLLLRGLKICDEEEVGQCDAARTRVHHNLGRLYAENRQWAEAMLHTMEDIKICRSLPHPQGEAKGLMNLGLIYVKQLQYEDAMQCYNLAHNIVRKLQDEDMLLQDIESNKQVVETAIPKMAGFKERLARHKKIQTKVDAARGTPSERTQCLLEFKFLKEIIVIAFELQHWEEHLRLGKRLKKVTKILGDHEKIGDAFEIMGESYRNLCKYEKAKKWLHKSFLACQRVNHLEGQAVALINYGNAVDSAGDYRGALKSFQQAYDILKPTGDTQHLVQKIDALENMHYCYIVRFDNIDEARRMEAEMNRLKLLKEGRQVEESSDEVCSETDDEAEVMDFDDEVPAFEPLPDNPHSTRVSDPEKNSDSRSGVARRTQAPKRSRVVVSDQESEDSADAVIPSPSKKNFTQANVKSTSAEKGQPPQSSQKQKTETLYLSSDEDDPLATALESYNAAARKKTSLRKEENFSGESQPEDKEKRRGMGGAGDMSHTAQGSRGAARRSSSSHHDGAATHNSDTNAREILLQAPKIVPVNINGQTLRVIIRRSETETIRTVGWLMEEIVRLYMCDNSAGKIPAVQRLEFKGSVLKPVQIIEEVLVDITSDDSVDAIVQGWLVIPVVERYEAHCIASNATVNSALALKLRLLKGSYEEVDASSCDLHDESVRPLIAALQENDALSSLDLSHNLLGNATMKEIQKMVAVTNQSDLGLTLDLHMNQLGAGALMQIVNCPVTLSRLEVLKLSGNRLTDAAGRSLAAILAQSKALATLEIERCGLTTRTIQQISISLQPESSLVKLCIGHNNPIGGSALHILFQKLSRLLSFTELDLRGIELDEKAVRAVTSLMKSSSSLSVLNLTGCEIQNHGVQVMSRALMGSSVQLLNIDMSSCGLSREPALEICQLLTSIDVLSTLNLSNNQLNEQAIDVLSSALRQEGCRLRSVSLNCCSIGPSGILHLLESLQGNSLLWELHVAGNISRESAEPLAVASVPEIVPQAGGPQNEDSQLDLMNADTQQAEDFLNSAIRVPDPVVEDLVVKVRMARGLQCLNMSENGLSADHVKQLWEAWCDGGRKGDRGFMGNAHFSVCDGRNCSACITSCVHCQST